MNFFIYKKKIILIIFFCFILLFQLSAIVSAAGLGDAFSSKFLGVAGETAGFDTTYTPEDYIGLIIQTALSFIGVIFLILMIYGGYTWMTAHGNEEQVTKARKAIIAAIIGLIIVISAYALSYFIISKLGEGALKAGQ